MQQSGRGGGNSSFQEITWRQGQGQEEAGVEVLEEAGALGVSALGVVGYGSDEPNGLLRDSTGLHVTRPARLLLSQTCIGSHGLASAPHGLVPGSLRRSPVTSAAVSTAVADNILQHPRTSCSSRGRPLVQAPARRWPWDGAAGRRPRDSADTTCGPNAAGRTSRDLCRCTHARLSARGACARPPRTLPSCSSSRACRGDRCAPGARCKDT
eukprot:Amastigsp_a339721_97.p4 type:complete len:211 gc:universal Amastigsp_a339721_97:9-641(+)